MSYGGARNWPPTWRWLSGGNARDGAAQGEIGTLIAVILPKEVPPTCCELLIEHDSGMYAGTLHFDDSDFCQWTARLLRQHLHRALTEIGEVETKYL